MKYKYYYYSYLPRTNHFYFTFYLSFPLMCTQHTHTTDRDCLSYSFSVDVCSIYLNIVSSHNIIFEPYCDCHVPSHITLVWWSTQACHMRKFHTPARCASLCGEHKNNTLRADIHWRQSVSLCYETHVRPESSWKKITHTISSTTKKRRKQINVRMTTTTARK